MLSRGLNSFRSGTMLLKFLFLSCKDRGISTELTTALRPFYFAVHPDFFGQYPEQRTVNENSLKQLSAYIESLHDRKYHMLLDKTLLFYIRDSSASTRDTFKQIRVTLDQHIRDPKALIERLLELCNLSTEYVKSIKPSNTDSGTTAPTSSPFQSGQDYTVGASFTGFEYSFYKAKNEGKKTLDTWIVSNAVLARARTKDLADLKEEVEKLQKMVIQRLGLRDARYDCGWNFEHYRGCLKTLERLADMHEQHVNVLRNRVVVFAPFTGVSLEGHVMLYTGDVLNNWKDFLKNIPRQDQFLKKIPFYESTLSQVLRQIKIGRRKFMPKQQAVEYAAHLMKVTTTLGDYLTVNKFPKSWPESLTEYEIVIESEAGPLMVNPTGQLIAPATCPGFMLIDFITTNLDIAKKRTVKYNHQKYIERELVARCIKDLKLRSLTKDDSITPEKMIDALSKLLSCDLKLFQNIDLHITNYYSVLTDGIVCVPWDFATTGKNC